MAFSLPVYRAPNFDKLILRDASDCRVAPVTRDGIAPEGYHALSIYPEYFRVAGRWRLIEHSRMDCVAVVREDAVEAVEFRRLREGDQVVLGRREDGSEGILVYTGGFRETDESREPFAFRGSRTRETAYSVDYDRLYEVLRHEREHGYTVWVLGPAVVFDHDSRRAMARLIREGYVSALLAGNALAVHDLECAVLGTALGQDIYTQLPAQGGHYHPLDIIHAVRQAGSLEAYVKAQAIDDGVMAASVEKDVPYVLAGSIRDDGPLPDVEADVYRAQDRMRYHTSRATTLVCLATQLHTIATGNMTPAYTVVNDQVRPVYIYCVDIAEFAVNKLRDRGSLEVTSIVTNVQDFLVHLDRNL
jgi:lysine-ketoglutarate reductase/saccharopine dehydrogenase-like protein (TIGR00300 family)